MNSEEYICSYLMPPYDTFVEFKAPRHQAPSSAKIFQSPRERLLEDASNTLIDYVLERKKSNYRNLLLILDIMWYAKTASSRCEEKTISDLVMLILKNFKVRNGSYIKNARRFEEFRKLSGDISGTGYFRSVYTLMTFMGGSPYKKHCMFYEDGVMMSIPFNLDGRMYIKCGKYIIKCHVLFITREVEIRSIVSAKSGCTCQQCEVSHGLTDMGFVQPIMDTRLFFKHVEYFRTIFTAD